MVDSCLRRNDGGGGVAKGEGDGLIWMVWVLRFLHVYGLRRVRLV